MTWPPEEALQHEKNALRLLLDERDGQFTRSSGWYRQDDSGIPDGVWSLLHDKAFVRGNFVGGAKWRLTVDGWIEACRLLRDEISLNKRFEDLSKHPNDLRGCRTKAVQTTVQAIATATGVNEFWVLDAISGRMAERVFGQRGAKIISDMGDVEIPSHIGNKVSSQ